MTSVTGLQLLRRGHVPSYLVPPTSTRPLPRVHKSAFRIKVEHASDPFVQRLSRVPGPLVLGVLMLLIAAGVLVRGPVGVVFIALVALVHGWGIYLACPRLSALERQMRLSVLLLLVALGVVSLMAGLS